MTIESTYPRFDWIKWNASRLTTAEPVRQTVPTREAPTTARTADTIAVRQPPHPLRRRSLYTRRGSVCVRSCSGARAAAHNAAGRPHAGVGVDREVGR